MATSSTGSREEARGSSTVDGEKTLNDDRIYEELEDETTSSEEWKENNRRMEERESIGRMRHTNHRSNIIGKIPMISRRQHEGKCDAESKADGPLPEKKMNSDGHHLSPPIRRRHNPRLLVGRSVVGEVWLLSVFQPSSTPPPHQPGHNCATPIETDSNSPINSQYNAWHFQSHFLRPKFLNPLPIPVTTPHQTMFHSVNPLPILVTTLHLTTPRLTKSPHFTPAFALFTQPAIRLIFSSFNLTMPNKSHC
ncbi:hypothetical protein Bca4012_032526 [Brassica carinata]